MLGTFIMMAERQVLYERLVDDLHFWRNVTKIEWDRSGYAPDECFGSGLANYSVFTACGSLSVIPAFWLYEHAWNRSDVKSPFRKNWVEFDFRDESEMFYVKGIIEVMREQLEMWGVDEASRKSLLYSNFEGYIDSLVKFVVFVIMENDIESVPDFVWAKSLVKHEYVDIGDATLTDLDTWWVEPSSGE